jgi:cytoskeletal protein RodZ
VGISAWTWSAKASGKDEPPKAKDGPDDKAVKPEGDDGQANVQDAEKPEKPEKQEKAEKQEKQEKSNKPEKPEKVSTPPANGHSGDGIGHENAPGKGHDKHH